MSTTKTIVGTSTVAALLVSGGLLINNLSTVAPETRPVIAAIQRTNDMTLISFTTESNYFYLAYACTNINAPVWLKLYGEAQGNGSIQTIVDRNNAPKKFYRVLRVNSIPPIPPYPPLPPLTNEGDVL